MSKYYDKCELVYSMLGDDISKEIYEARVMYSLTNASRYERKLMESSKVAKRFADVMARFKGKPIIIYGAGTRGRMLAWELHYDWVGYVDSNSDLWGGELNGLPIMPLSDALSKFPKAVVVVSNKFDNQKIEKMLATSGIERESIVNIGAWLTQMQEDTYFDLPQLVKNDKEVFVDLGGYDGFTSKRFAKWCNGNFEHIYCFEPDPINSAICRDKMSEYFMSHQYTFIQKGTWESIGSVAFDGNGTEEAKIDGGGKDNISVTTLDEELKGKKVTYIKMDIEGAELETLKGAEEIIRSQLPKLAISVYHKRSDIFTIPGLIREYSDQYKFYLRHYTINIVDTILYAIPQRYEQGVHIQ